MNPEALFLYMIAAAALVLAFTNLFLLSIKKGKTAVTTGTVISISMPLTLATHTGIMLSRRKHQVSAADCESSSPGTLHRQCP